jgi:predicted nucleic acid-binding protein
LNAVKEQEATAKQSRLFDASALVNLLVSQGSSALDLARGNDILDLTIYEAGNALWKLSTLHTKMSAAEADSLQSALIQTVTDHMNVITVSELDHTSIANLARTERLSYYDAAYVWAARDRKSELITDDARLARAASKFVKVRKSSDLPSITSED